MKIKDLLKIIAEADAEFRCVTDRDLPEELLRGIFLAVREQPGYEDMVMAEINKMMLPFEEFFKETDEERYSPELLESLLEALIELVETCDAEFSNPTITKKARELIAKVKS